MDDIGLGKVTVTNLKQQSQRIDYINKVFEKIPLVKPNADMEEVEISEIQDKPKSKKDPPNQWSV